MRKTKNELTRLQVAGFYCDVELGDPSKEIDDIQKKKDEARRAREEATRRKEDLKASGLSKLTPEEKAALGIKG
jgi:hypothetical protein